MKLFHRHPRSLPIIAMLLASCFTNSMGQQTPASVPPPATEVAVLPDADLELLAKTAEHFVKAFNQKDAPAIAALFLPSGELEDGSGEIYRGREEIRAHYEQLFAGDEVPLISLEANSVRSIATGLAVEDGVIHLTLSEDEPITSVEYSATHIRQADGSWLIATNRNLPEVAPPAERLKPLHWLVGEWTMEGEDGLRVDMVLHLDSSGSYLLGESLVSDAEGESQSTQLRIGWNPATASIYWWTFDSAGGFTAGSWARNGDEWTIATSGFTAEAEANSTTQTLTRVREDSMVWIAKDRLLVDETLPDISLNFVRRAPDPGVRKAATVPAAENKNSSPEKD